MQILHSRLQKRQEALAMKQRMQPGELSKEGLQKSVNLLLEVDLEALALDQRMQHVPKDNDEQIAEV